MPTFYSGKGDHGNTGRLGTKARVSKSSVLIEAIGDLDEANCAIGIARALVKNPGVQRALPDVQRHLITLMAHLSATPEKRRQYSGLSTAEVVWLEEVIAEIEGDLAPLHDFVLPGATHAGAACHMARAVVRRAERKLVAVSEAEPEIMSANLAFLNRLSSLMFVAALQEDELTGS